MSRLSKRPRIALLMGGPMVVVLLGAALVGYGDPFLAVTAGLAVVAAVGKATVDLLAEADSDPLAVALFKVFASIVAVAAVAAIAAKVDSSLAAAGIIGCGVVGVGVGVGVSVAEDRAREARVREGRRRAHRERVTRLRRKRRLRRW